jgi:ABC-type multidrug transport system ATPase subunit
MIDVCHVSKSFGVVRALDDVCLQIRPGERIGFVGANGSGKTTLLRALLGLVRVEGRVYLGGIDVARDPELALRATAYIPQVAPPIEAPVFEVVRAIASLRGIDEVAVGLRAHRLGLDLAHVRRTRFRDLSGGSRQKLLAALALATEARILVCDEPTANLDRKARGAFFEQVAARESEAITVLCSHRVEEIEQLVDRVLELDGGRVVRDAPARAVIAELSETPAPRLRLVQ